MPPRVVHGSVGSDRPTIKTRPQRPPPPHLNTYVSKLFANIASRTHFAEPGLLQRWSEIVGPELATLGRPGRILGGTRGATLELIAQNGAAAARLQFESESIRRRVNQILGPERIGQVQLRQAGAPDAAPVASALSRFRASIAARGE